MRKYKLKVRMEFIGTIHVIAENKNEDILMTTVGLNYPTLQVNNNHSWKEGETSNDKGVKDCEFDIRPHNLKIY